MEFVEAIPTADDAVSLYESVEWTNYSENPPMLMSALENSRYVVCVYDDGALIGLARAISDDASVVFIQDILVRPERQSTGIGRALFERVFTRFKHVSRKVLTTGEEPMQFKFYESMGFTNVAKTPLNAFIRIEGYSFIENS